MLHCASLKRQMAKAFSSPAGQDQIFMQKTLKSGWMLVSLNVMFKLGKPGYWQNNW